MPRAILFASVTVKRSRSPAIAHIVECSWHMGQNRQFRIPSIDALDRLKREDPQGRRNGD